MGSEVGKEEGIVNYIVTFVNPDELPHNDTETRGKARWHSPESLSLMENDTEPRKVPTAERMDGGRNGALHRRLEECRRCGYRG